MTWFKVLYTILHSKKGISSRQLRRMFYSETSSLHTAWHVGRRLRAAMYDEEFNRLVGIVEVDETYIGGKGKNRHWNKRSHKTGGEASGKTPVISAIAHKDNIVCRTIENTTHAALDNFVDKTASPDVSLLATDEHPAYEKLSRIYSHQIMQHRDHVYVRGEVHTNNIESFWSLLKREIMGSFYYLNRKYLPLHLAEFTFHHNNRKNPDIFGAAIAGC